MENRCYDGNIKVTLVVDGDDGRGRGGIITQSLQFDIIQGMEKQVENSRQPVSEERPRQITQKYQLPELPY